LQWKNCSWRKMKFGTKKITCICLDTFGVFHYHYSFTFMFWYFFYANLYHGDSLGEISVLVKEYQNTYKLSYFRVILEKSPWDGRCLILLSWSFMVLFYYVFRCKLRNCFTLLVYLASGGTILWVMCMIFTGSIEGWKSIFSCVVM